MPNNNRILFICFTIAALVLLRYSVKMRLAKRAPHGVPAWAVGDRVLSRWHDGIWFYPATVQAVDGRRLEIHYDDGDRAWQTDDRVRALDIRVGQRVNARWKNGQYYYWGTIAAVEPRRIFIKYDDGDSEWTTVAVVRLPAGS